MPDKKHKFQVLQNREIVITVNEAGNAVVECDCWDPERPFYNAALRGLLKAMELTLEHDGRIPVAAVQEAVRELYYHDYKIPKLEEKPDPKDYTIVQMEVVAKGEAPDIEEGLWWLLTSLPGVRAVNMVGSEEADDWALEVDPYDERESEEEEEEEENPIPIGALHIEPHVFTPGYCNYCEGQCEFDRDGEWVGAENHAAFE